MGSANEAIDTVSIVKCIVEMCYPKCRALPPGIRTILFCDIEMN